MEPVNPRRKGALGILWILCSLKSADSEQDRDCWRNATNHWPLSVGQESCHAEILRSLSFGVRGLACHARSQVAAAPGVSP